MVLYCPAFRPLLSHRMTEELLRKPFSGLTSSNCFSLFFRLFSLLSSFPLSLAYIFILPSTFLGQSY
ncbi:hypothetical protein BDV26DRAFT_75848 [Aspergillus bertholletiae]|uniref:Uncharacterized protein n=1 Tax=Aspergillus bertholletiae TaxID=1226010 RepID=A0A5N7AVP6_9EURO|nr:hypothetical protein BDV26DRAFT_75848 [Aspergillus bertholletiae]